MNAFLAIKDVSFAHGGKAVGLRRLLEMGLAVPDGIAIDSAGVRRLIDGDKTIETQLRNWLSTRGGRFAIRSSAENEDGAEQSFAGMYESLLGISGSENAIIEGVREVARSGQSDRVLNYSGGVIETIPVIIQRLVEASASGVLFTQAVDVSGSDCAYIEWVSGLGDALVSGKVTPATVVLPWQKGHEQIDRDRIRIGKSVPSSLSVEKWIGLIEEIVRSTNSAGWDVEWAIDSQEKLWALQMRPITTEVLVPQEGVAAGPLPASPGTASGVARFVDDSNHELLQEGEVLIAEITEVNYIPAMRRAAAIVTEEGGLLSHAAIVAREFGKPCVVGAKGALTLLVDSTMVEVNGSAGTVRQGELLLGGGVRSEIDWSFLYLYDRGFELTIADTTAYVEPTLDGILAHVDYDTTAEQQGRIDIGIRRIFRKPPNVVKTDRKIWHREWRRFYQLRTVTFVESTFKAALASWDLRDIRYAVTMLKGLAVSIKNETSSTPMQTLFWKELGAALHSLVWLVVEGHAVWQAYRDSADWRARCGVKFADFMHGAPSLTAVGMVPELESVHSCLDALAELRNSAYPFFADNGVFDDGYFGSRAELVREVCQDIGAVYIDENDSLNELYKNQSFRDLDRHFWETAVRWSQSKSC